MPNTPPSTSPRKALGRGLSALLPARPPEAVPAAQAVSELPLGAIDPNPDQPRGAFDEDALQGLANSIRADGVLQPVLVRPAGGRYTLIVGERRLKAAKKAGLATIPAIVRDVPADRLLEVTLVENIQREDLNPIEIATILDRMLSKLDIVHDEIAERTGMSRTSVTNHLRLLKLPIPVINLVRGGKLQMGHARALLALDSTAAQEALAGRAVATSMSVRAVEDAVRRLQAPPRKRKPPALDPNVADAVKNLEHALQAPVTLRGTATKGRIEIAYSSSAELAQIYDRIIG